MNATTKARDDIHAGKIIAADPLLLAWIGVHDVRMSREFFSVAARSELAEGVDSLPLPSVAEVL